jgi:aminopeptidase N
MRVRRLLVLAAIFVSSVAARQRVVLPPVIRDAPADIFSAAQPALVRTTHLSLDLTVDFDAQVIRGSATHEIDNPSATHTFIVDTNALDIDAVTADGRTTTWSFGTAAANGTPLVIDIAPSTRSVRIDYRTRPEAAALHWLTAKQTHDGVLPAVWSASEPYGARSWIPLQDTPPVDATYDATVRVPPGALAIMSAANNATAANGNGIYTFSMPHPIPSYLIALAAGRLAFRDLGNRTGVYAEPQLLDDTAYEMQFLPDMLGAAERVIGPYPFERYDLVFPPRFSGGMENPELNFIGDSFITGNHPAVVPPAAVIAHELSHSWFGDDVRLANWTDIWLNEGFATYYEKRIEEEMSGWERAELGLYQDRQSLASYLAGNPSPRLTALHRTFAAGEQPSFTIIWYIKGEMFLETLERTMGRDSFDALSRRYVMAHVGGWVDDVAFHAALPASPDLQADAWLYDSAMPSNFNAPASSAIWNRISAQATAFRSGASARTLDTRGWTSIETNVFLSTISDIIVGRVDDLDAAFGFSQMNTPPTLWLVSIARTLRPIDQTVLNRYLARGWTSSTAVWSALSATPAGTRYAVPLFRQVRDSYDPATQATIANMLHL